MRRLAKFLLIANLCLWIYFAAGFAYVAQPYDPRPAGHVPVDVYCFWGHAIGLTTSSFLYPFMRIIFVIEFPSFLFVTLIQQAFLSRVSADRFVFGISVGGYKLLAIMLLSFLQWYLIALAIRKLWNTWFGQAGTATN